MRRVGLAGPVSRRCGRLGWIAFLFTMAFSGNPGPLAARALDPAPANRNGTGDPSAIVTPATVPIVHRRIHYVGDFWTSFANDGTFGSNHGGLGSDPRDRSPLGITWTPSEEFPGGSRVDYLYVGSLWIGGIVGTDTTVSMSITSSSAPVNEFNGFTLVESGLPPNYSSGCGEFGMNKHLEQTYWCVYYDTMIPNTTDAVDARPHIPLGLEVTQVSHQSSDNFSRRFVIYDLQIKNISNHAIDNMYMGIFQDNDCYYELQTCSTENKYDDDISGIVTTWPNPRNPVYTDTLNTMWAADNDGDPCVGGVFPRVSARGAVGIRMLRGPAGAHLSFNWWPPNFGGASFDWSPHLITDTRNLGTGGSGDPVGDRNSYWYMANGEIDYSQLFSGVDFTAQGWRKPPAQAFACNIANGLDTRNVIALGPVTRLDPGETVPFTFAIIAGANVHRIPDNQFDCANPQAYLNRMDFSDFAKNAWWAGYVFDNYGVDTDGDGYAGEYYPQIGSDTTRVYYTGDGCPDFSGPRPPPCPQARIITCNGAVCDTVRSMTISSSPGQLRLWWTGQRTELEVNSLLRARDFEGYRVYVSARNSRDDIPSSEEYSLLASWDVIDYRRYTYDDHLEQWLISSNPATEEQWYAQFQNQSNPFKGPKAYDAPSFERAYRYMAPDTAGHPVEKYAYFAPQDYNQGNEYQVGNETVRNRIQQIAERDTTIGLDTTTLHFGEYTLTLDSLLPSKVYFVSVTAFNFGDPANKLEPQECFPGGGNTVLGVPIYSSDTIQAYWNSGGAKSDSLRVIVYPNPYKSAFTDASGHRTNYFDLRYEGSGGAFDERQRRIHFINLPDSARIRIYTLDGDLVRELNHPDKFLSEYSSKISWDLISRNTQAVESGIYIYRVDFPPSTHMEPQVGKIVIIK
ncbi:MAG: hypothetical protein HY304_04455 [candidate division Zixibacteria bacterium]|nr:hypothetical protein [candidate division Zixibacteria bacterium]